MKCDGLWKGDDGTTCESKILGFLDADEIRSAMLNGFPVEDN